MVRLLVAGALACLEWLAGAAAAEDVKYPAATAPAKTWAPTVKMSAEHRATCKAVVGDKLPEMKLVDLDGKETTLATLLGKDASVVMFWKADQRYAREQFTRFEREVADAFAAKGVKAIAINVGDSPEAVRAIAEEYGCDFPSLLDRDGTAFASVAASKLPRTYVLDGDGKILWMDIEYSVTTRRELANALWRQLGVK